jgi:hypothetical protein
MSDELLQVRKRKIELHKISIKYKTPEHTHNYITQRNLYNTLLRQHKQKYYADNLQLNINNSKHTWQLLKEAANLTKTNSSIEKMTIMAQSLLTLQRLRMNSMIFSPVLG